MATITNRSSFIVSVAKRPKLTKQFTFKQETEASRYVLELESQGHQPDVQQLETSFQVRVRQKGVREQFITFQSFTEADQFVAQLDADQKVGLLRDYTQGAQTTTVQLIERYIREECPGLKGGDTYATILNAMVDDSCHLLRERIEQRKSEMLEFGKTFTSLGANRVPMTSLEWLNLPLTKVRPDHFEDFIRDRLEYVSAATVDRQLDLLSRIYNLTTSRWRIHLAVSPKLGIKRPSYFNERDRRLVGDEEDRLIEAARKEDRVRSLELHVATLAADDVAAARQLTTHYAVNEARKSAYERARRRAMAEGFPHIPLLEAFVMFQLATSARRGEALGLFWNQVNSEQQVAAMPTSKNGRPRKLAVRRDILDLLDKLPKSSDLVFDISIKELAKAWRRICESARIEDLHIHDLRHEGISRAAESGKFPTVLDLQAYSGHRDLRSLSRYTHLCMSAIAKRLEEAEAARLETRGNKGRKRMAAVDLLWLGGGAEQPDAADAKSVATGLDESADAVPALNEAPTNVLMFKPKLKSAS